MTDSEAVIDEVASAFGSEPLPPNNLLTNMHCDECIEIAEAFGGMRWQTITLEQLVAGAESSLLTAAAWRYYLPAVITWCVRAPESCEMIHDIRDNLVYQLEPPDASAEPSLQTWFSERACDFSESQRQAIVAYLKWYQHRQAEEYGGLDMEPPRNAYRALEHWTSTSSQSAG